MSWLDVLDGGLLTTVQDLGRIGAQRYGVPVSGAMDPFALRAANRLVGNADGLAALEITLVGPDVHLSEDVTVAVTGADLAPHVDGAPLPMWQAVRVRGGSRLSFAGVRDGMRAYLAAAGGFAVPRVLGSRSTFTRAAFGGHEGRALRSGDRLRIDAAPVPAQPVTRRLLREAVPRYGHASSLRVVLGPQDDAFTEDGLATFLRETYTLTPQSDRIGCRFSGARITHRAGADIVSDGTAFGAVQITGDGLPIVLMADRGTTGGYTKIATVVTADLPRVAQSAPGHRVHFVAVTVAEAQCLLREQEQILDAISESAVEPDSAATVYEEDSASALLAGAFTAFAAALGTTTAAGARAAHIVRAPMPGLVVSVLVSPGEAVDEKQPLLVIEAMKMQNPVRAPRAGRIARTLVSAGDTVDTGRPLVEFETDRQEMGTPHDG
ncbi:MAG: 5-oxoprolinase/urea amidolyase family protein [Acidobacteria bacterium]|nr:5-oxoprolinase/urea amidolyase family protein [Acidobacteriota bacterium]